MDNVTHTLFALTLARTRLGRSGRGATAALVLASNAPDIDIVATLGGTANYLTWHRGPTHGPLGIAGLGALTAAIVWAWLRFRGRNGGERSPAAPPATFGRLLVLSIIGVSAHILMDLPTSYGTRLLSPFDWRWFAVDWMPIVDIYLLTALGAALVFGALSADARRRNVAIALGLLVGIYGVRGVAHGEALSLAPRLFGPTLPRPCNPQVPSAALLVSWPQPQVPVMAPAEGRCLIDVAALPTFLSPFTWRVVAHLTDSYQVEDVDVLDRRFRSDPLPSEALWRRAVRFPNAATPITAEAARSPIVRIFLAFARMPDARVSPESSGGALVEWTDLRFLNGPLTARGRGRLAAPFTATVRLDADNRIVDERLGP